MDSKGPKPYHYMCFLRASIIILFTASHFCCYDTSQGRASDEENTSERSEQKGEEKDSSAPYVEGQVLVKFKEDGTPDKLGPILPEAEVKILDYFPEIGVYYLEIKGAGTVPEIIEKLQGSSLVEYAEPNYIQTILDDPSL